VFDPKDMGLRLPLRSLEEMRRPGGCPLGGPGSHQAHSSYRAESGRRYSFRQKSQEKIL
jgi:hypothetical protein